MTVFEFPNPDNAKDVPRIRVQRGMFFADIILDRRSTPSVYIVILQQYGSQMVRGISQHASMDEAQQSAEEDLQKLTAAAA